MGKHDQDDFIEMNRFLRRTADEIDNALADRLDIDDALAKIESGGVNEVELHQTLASWRTELLGAVRGDADIIRPVDAPEFFQAMTGRERGTTEPWPELRITAPGESVLTMSVHLPDHDMDHFKVGAALTVAGHRHVTELRPEGSHEDTWGLVELLGTVTMQRDDVSLQGAEVELWVEWR
ncbi:hypothetical protein HNR06_000963 [Nocardiopsis arvandica]|uniref:Uncharacterized protein n=1 Tax=Nocardiopsis sinuspersici TaxID=501010 RepID=A0A7Y9X9C3_9ACTN|nr:hypothetical protein [Nocardiopsis sinuspersici]NYH51374.1 hypothetical protein [Nocardiopsis sinuspersici]